MKPFILLFALLFTLPATAQDVLTLDSCRAMALRCNREILIGRAMADKAYYDRKAAYTNYLPKVALTAGYLRTGREVSLLNSEQKGSLAALGTNAASGFQSVAEQIAQQMPELTSLIQSLGTSLVPALDQAGQDLVDALSTDTRNLLAGTVMLTQPLYMGGKIRAYYKISRYAEEVAGQQLRADEQEVILNVDQAYWQVVSLKAKKQLAEKNLDLLRHLDDDMQKMVTEGVATKAQGLSVSVKTNEAEMLLTRVDNALRLAQMLLCQLCGLPLDSELQLCEQDLESSVGGTQADVRAALDNRPEIRQLETAIDIYHEKVKVERSAALPSLALTGGYMLSNPNLFNSFEKKFRGTWMVGLSLSVPIWNWGEYRYKVQSAKTEAEVAQLRYDDAKEKIELQVSQASSQVEEAGERLALSLKNRVKVEENLRTARIGFKEGTVAASDVLAAATAWLQAQTEVIDAQIDVRLTDVCLRKALGTLDVSSRP